MLALTPSKVRDFQACPYQYKLKHLDKRGRPMLSPALAFGTSLHAALAELHNPTRAESKSTDLKQLLRRHWIVEGYRDEAEAEAFFRQGVEALGRYEERAGNTSAQVLATEAYLSRIVRFGGVPVKLSCKVDRVSVRADGVLEVCDYKTQQPGRVPTAEWLQHDLPTFIYYVLTRIAYPQYERVVVATLNLLTLATVEAVYDAAQLAANKQALSDLVRQIDVGVFRAQACEACAWCSVQLHCPLFSSEVNINDII